MHDSIWVALIVLFGQFLSYKYNKTSNKKLDHITILTNSTLTAANQRIVFLENQVKVLIDKDKVEN